MRKAVYFDNPEDFRDFVQSRGAEAFPGKPDELFEWLRVVHPERPGDLALVIFFTSGGAITPGHSIEAEVSGQSLLWSRPEPPAPLVSRGLARTLLECVSLAPWDEHRSDRALRGAVFFLVRSSSALASLIQGSIQLGNDRIQFGGLASAEGEELVLVKIDKPSFYLIQACLEEQADSVEIFYPEGGELYVRWGWQHPLIDWWRRSERKREGLWIFFGQDADFFHAPPVIWRDAYDLTGLDLDFSHRQVLAQSSSTPPRFEVLLRLAPRAAAQSEPELWLLDEAGLQQLEETLQISDDEALRSWQIACQRWDDPPVRDWIFIRELRATARQARHHDFGGTAFIRFQGINNLLLPSGFDLQPPLRRDAYRRLFDLEAGFTTVLVPEKVIGPPVKDDGFAILKLSDRAFGPLASYVDYLVARESATLQDLMKGSVFDFKHYLKAPKHAGPGADRNEAENRRGPVMGIDPVSDAPSSSPDADTSSSGASIGEKLSRPFEDLDESALGTLEKEELRLERTLIQSGQSLDLWCDLLVCKNQLGKTSDAVVSAIEALWLARGTPREAGLTANLKTLALASLGKEARLAAPDDSEWVRRAAVFATVMNAPAPHHLDSWISETISFLRLHENGLRCKDRWLAWGFVLSRNLDERQEIRLREEIRNRIVGHGLGIEETPSFLRTRLFLDRVVSETSGDQSAAETAVVNLESIQSVAETFCSPRLSLAGRAVLARAYSKIGDVARAQRMMVETDGKSDACGRAWEALFQSEALRGIDQSRAEAIDRKMPDLLNAAGTSTGHAVSQLRKDYLERRNAENPAAFLARENRGRTYPHGPLTQQGELWRLSRMLEEDLAAGNEDGAVAVMRNMMTLENTRHYDHHVRLPQFVEILVAGLERYKWGEKGRGLIPLFESFSARVPNYVTTRDHFYGSILHSNLALGLLEIENLEKAVQQVSQAQKLVETTAGELDFIDSAAALVKTAEQLPLSHRGSLLFSLMENIQRRFDQPKSPYLSNEQLFAPVVRLIDQIAEAASSQDRLSQQQFRHYQLQDEFLILQRIQHETFIV